MCGIFGIVSNGDAVPRTRLRYHASRASRRGSDSSGLMISRRGDYYVYKAYASVNETIKTFIKDNVNLVIGHGRLITDGFADNQPVCRDGVFVFHNGIICNTEEIWSRIGLQPAIEIDSEAIAGIVSAGLRDGLKIEEIAQDILGMCAGSVSCCVVVPELGKGLIASNNGSLFYKSCDGDIEFASEKYTLSCQSDARVTQLKNSYRVFDIPLSNAEVPVTEKRSAENRNIFPMPIYQSALATKLTYPGFGGRRCSKCILPETMPHINFDSDGVCNYCRNYKKKTQSGTIDDLKHLLSEYYKDGDNAIIPFSGGRDSSWALHIACKELNLKPITFTYDWGMVTDLARRNISRLCNALDVENILVAANVRTKRDHIKRNLAAWLKAPHLGMVNLLMAGDKHFFKYIETVKDETSIGLNIWGMSPYETTHFKTGFLGVRPNFELNVYATGLASQFRYHSKRIRQMVANPAYINASLLDTYIGEYYRSINKKTDYFHLFDYIDWSEAECLEAISEYDWERATDTEATWRIGDGTAPFYNYIFRTVAGFTENDTFRSNQVRDGVMDRDEALAIVNTENEPRFQSIKWYLDVLGFDFKKTIDVINSIPRLY